MDMKLIAKTENNDNAPSCDRKGQDKRRRWRKPKLEDVSGKIMAQPYIRFT